MENINEELAKEIEKTALAHGFSSCGIIPLSAMDGYAAKFYERMEKVPESVPFYQRFEGLTKIKERYPWAKSLIICVSSFAKYKFPKELQGKYAKGFLLSRNNHHESKDYQGKKAFEAWLSQKGMHWEGGDGSGFGQVGGLRYAAVTAGLGIIRHNNFFYDENGSCTELDGYVIDAECTLYHHKTFTPCSDRCGLCRKNCPTHALSDANTMNPLLCASFCTTFANGMTIPGITEEMLGTRVMGCDTCQDVCPYNRRKKWDEGEDYPGLEEMVPTLDPAHLAEASDEEIQEKVICWTDDHMEPNQTEFIRQNARRALRQSLCKNAAD